MPEKGWGFHSSVFTPLFDAELIELLKTKRNFKEETDLNPGEKQKIKDHFNKLGDENQEELFFEILKNCGDLATIEKVMNFLKDECYSDKPIYSTIMGSVKDLDRRSWAIKHFKQGFGYKLKKKLGLNPSWIKRHVKPRIFCLKAILSVHIDFIKDIVIYLALTRYNELILVS